MQNFWIRKRDMALVLCKECNKAIDARAKTCPECGAPTENVPATAYSRKLGWKEIVGGLFICGLLLTWKIYTA